MDKAKQEQVIAQLRVVRHLSNRLAEISDDYMKIMASENSADILDIVGNRSACQMEVLGDMLNGMDAADENADRFYPIFDKAQEMWPQRKTEII